ncbi:uncharacterized protein [Nicotiana tomentosiformis]|uniref:uncharacterized protein n=1 Tax=Nicotiana tomentosiformis TaxID=4098 RepID=UPI00388C7742
MNVDSKSDIIQEPEENENIKTTIEELEAITLSKQWPDRKVYVGMKLSPGMKGKLVKFLQAKVDCFAWSHSDMTGIPPEMMTYKLNEDPSYPPVKQKKRNQGSFKNQVIQDEIKPIEEIPDILMSKKEVQRLTGRIAALGRFIFKSSEKSFKFFSILKKQNQFEWTDECQQALKNLKAYLSNPPLLAKPKDRERLLIYHAVSEMAVSAVLVREDKGKRSPIYYVSKSLLDVETRYPHLKKLALALVMASRKLRPYFQCHPISVVTAYPLRNILLKQELSGRLAKWAIELSEYDIVYQPRTAIKSQVLADFVADFNAGIVPEAKKELQVFTGSNPGTWTLFTDGSSNVKEAGLGIVLIPPSGEIIRQAIKCYPITNNEAEYEAVIAGLELPRELGIEQIVIKSDSRLVVNQMQRTYITREVRMQQYLEKARELIRQFQSWKIVQIPKEENAEADALANLASVAEVTNAENAIVILLFHSALDQDKNETGTGETPFSLVYDVEALITVEVGEPSTRYIQATEESNEEEMRMNLDLLEERREAALIRMEAQKQIIERYYNQKGHLRYFKIGDFILKKVFQSTKAANVRKLSPNWEGPYRI